MSKLSKKRFLRLIIAITLVIFLSSQLCYAEVLESFIQDNKRCTSIYPGGGFIKPASLILSTEPTEKTKTVYEETTELKIEDSEQAEPLLKGIAQAWKGAMHYFAALMENPGDASALVMWNYYMELLLSRVINYFNKLFAKLNAGARAAAR